MSTQGLCKTPGCEYTVTEQDEVEVAHEALIRHWPRLRGWLDEDRDDLRWRAGIRQAALGWAASQRDESLLVHRGAGWRTPKRWRGSQGLLSH